MTYYEICKAVDASSFTHFAELSIDQLLLLSADCLLLVNRAVSLQQLFVIVEQLCMLLEDRLEITAQVVHRLAVAYLPPASHIRTVLQKNQCVIGHLQFDLPGVFHRSPAAIFLLNHVCTLTGSAAVISPAPRRCPACACPIPRVAA